MAATRPKSSILITGGNGSLGSAIGLQLETTQPQQYHFILTARSLTDACTLKTSASFSALNASFEFQILDLSSLKDVKSFASGLRERVARNEIPKFPWGGVVNSAALVTYVKDGRTEEGWNDMYATNVLAPVLLVRELLPVLENAIVVNVVSVTHTGGTVDYFAKDGKNIGEARADEVLGLAEAMKRYGSTKLTLIMAGYALQRKLDEKSYKVQVVALDPGGMSGDSRLGAGSHWLIKIAQAVLAIIGPIVRYFKKDAINPPEVPAKAIAELFEKPANTENGVAGKYFILDDEVKSSQTSLDEKMQEDVWEKICKDLEINVNI